MRRPYKVRIALLMLLVSVAATRAADAEVTTAAFASCNEQAPEAVKAGTATPIMGDHVRAENARAGAMTTHSVTDFTGKVIKSSDPQNHGMDAEGAKDARYQAAYRSCMLMRSRSVR